MFFRKEVTFVYQVKIFEEKTPSDLEKNINEFLIKNNFKEIVDLKYVAYGSSLTESDYSSALLIYKI